MAKNVSTVTINAPAQNVWETLTQPELVKLWQYGSDLVTDWRVGSDIRFTTKWEDKVFEQWGKVLEIEQGTSLRYSLFAPRPGLEDKPENYFVMHYKLEETNGQTKLSIIQEDDRPGAVQEDPQDADNPVLQALKDVAEKRSEA